MYPKLDIAVFADGANLADMLKRNSEGFVKGFTTNPTLMAKAGLKDYEAFARSVLAEIKTLPISFEVFSDEMNEMERQALKIAAWGSNVNVKIPITNTRGESCVPLIQRLLKKDVKLNVTAIFTNVQCEGLHAVCDDRSDVIVSIFAGRIADTGIDPMPIMRRAVKLFADRKNAKVLWASPREVLNVYQAQETSCHIITATDDLISKLKQHGKPLDVFSLETVKMFYDDAKKAGFTL